MPLRDEDDLDDDPDAPDEADGDEDEWDEGGSAYGLVPCPYCRQMIYEGAEVCPKCGSYISEEDTPSDRPRWVVAVAVVLVAAILIGWVVYGR